MLLKIMALCPDDHIRLLFHPGGPPQAQGSRQALPLLRPGSPHHRLRIRFRNSCLEAIRIIYEAAMLGSPAANEKLHLCADELNREALMLTRDLMERPT
jgi:hypothetical protein